MLSIVHKRMDHDSKRLVLQLVCSWGYLARAYGAITSWTYLRLVFKEWVREAQVFPPGLVSDSDPDFYYGVAYVPFVTVERT